MPRSSAPRPPRGASAPNAQYWSGAQPRDMYRLQQERRQQLQAERAAANEQAMAQLSPLAIKLHNPVYGSIALAVYLLCLLITLVSNGNVPLVIVPWAVFAIVDWHNFITLHGLIPWKLWWSEHRGWVIVGLIVLYLLFLFTPIVYLAQCIQLAPRVLQQQRDRLRDEIARLEAELRALPPQPE